MLVTEITNLATSHVGCALGAREASVGIEDCAGGAAVGAADAADVEGVA